MVGAQYSLLKALDPQGLHLHKARKHVQTLGLRGPSASPPNHR